MHTYTPSGRIDSRLPIRMLGIGLPASALWSWAYVNVLALTLPWFVEVLIACVYVSVCSITVNSVVKMGHVRARRAATLSAVALSGVALWIRWLLTVRLAQGDHAAAAFATSAPWIEAQVLWHLAQSRAAATPGSLSAAWQTLSWMAEAGMMTAFSIGLARNQAETPYSETCHQWAEKESLGELYLKTRYAGTLKTRLDEAGIQELLDMPRANDVQVTTSASGWGTIKVVGHKVDADAQARWVTLELIDHARTSEGKIKSQMSFLVEYWQLTADDYSRLTAYLTDPSEPHRQSDPATGVDQARPTPPELEPAVAALQGQNATAALSLAAAQRQHPNADVRADALRVCALAHSQLKQWDDAFAQFYALFELEPTAHNALQLATVSVMAGQLLRGAAWFKQAEDINTQGREMPPPRMHSAYLSALEQAGETSACLPHLEWLANAYQTVGTSDPHVLFMRGLPFFSVFLERSLVILRACMPETEIIAWYQAMRNPLDPEGQAALDQHLQAMTKASSP